MVPGSCTGRIYILEHLHWNALKFTIWIYIFLATPANAAFYPLVTDSILHLCMHTNVDIKIEPVNLSLEAHFLFFSNWKGKLESLPQLQILHYRQIRYVRWGTTLTDQVNTPLKNLLASLSPVSKEIHRMECQQ